MSRSLLSTDFVRDLIERCVPLGQFETTIEDAVARMDLGLGFIYYGLTRALKPRTVVVIGSYRGFSVVCFALGHRDNGLGHTHFIDASKVDAFWTEAQRVREHFTYFGIDRFVSMHNLTTTSCLETVAPFNRGEPFIDILLIDGDHGRNAVARDFKRFSKLVREEGLVCLHDSLAGGFGKTPLQVAEFLSSLRIELYESLALECGKGLTIIKKIAPTWHSKERIRRDEIATTINSLMSDAVAEGRDVVELRKLATLIDKELTGTSQQERLIEVRQRYLAKSADSMRDQVRRLKLELKALRSTRA
jgi:predicted O-methyltransferase YrrM